MLVLDEATASVDTETEMLIQQALQSLLAGRTSFVIAHRLSTVRHADLILVLEQGRIASAARTRNCSRLTAFTAACAAPRPRTVSRKTKLVLSSGSDDRHFSSAHADKEIVRKLARRIGIAVVGGNRPFDRHCADRPARAGHPGDFRSA